MTRHRAGLAGALGAALAVSAAGCAANVNIASADRVGIPNCQSITQFVNGTLVLMAQAVPSAQWLPCMRSLPAGWSFQKIDVRDGQARFALDSVREGAAAVTVTLAARCGTGGATQVASDQPGARRYDRTPRLTSGYQGDRYYVYPGGCVTYHFNLRGQSRPGAVAGPVAEVSGVLGVVRRDSLARQVRANFGDQLTLDPGGPR